MQLTVETVTPKKAQQYLNRNKSNRTLRAGVVERYSEDMRNEAWTICTAPIVFYDNGDIADGQHRLWAIIESKKSQEFFIMRDLPKEAGLNIDTGLGRSLVDAAKISGIDEGLTHTLISTCRAYHFGHRNKIGIKGRSASNSEKLEWVAMYREPCEWAIHHGPVGKFVRNSIVLGAIARAVTYEKDPERLARFSDVLTKGFAVAEDESSAVAIRNYLLKLGQSASTDALWRDTFMKVQNAIWYFMRKKPLFVIKAQTDERYPRKEA